MLSWWKKKLSNGLGNLSPYERNTPGKRGHSSSSTISATASTVHTDRDLSSTYDIDTYDKDKSKVQEKSMTQCCKTFVNWTNWVLYGDQEYHDDMVRNIKDFQEPMLVEKILSKISGTNVFDEISNFSNIKRDDDNHEFMKNGQIYNNRMDENESNTNIDPNKVQLMENCIQFLMSHRRSFSVDMDISAKSIVIGQVSSILKLIWLIIVRFRLEAIAEKQLRVIKMESSEEISNLSGYNLLLQYCNSRLEAYRRSEIINELIDFSKSWCTGTALLCLVHSYVGKFVPGLTEYIDGTHPHISPTPLNNSDLSENPAVSLNSFPNPPENNIMYGNIKEGKNAQMHNVPITSREVEHNTAINNIKYLLFAGNKGSIKDCLEMALKVARENMGVPALISVQHIMEGSDELSMLAYLSEFFWICGIYNDPSVVDSIAMGNNHRKEYDINGDFFESIDKLVSEYIKEATNLLDLFLTLSNNNYDFISIIRFDRNVSPNKLIWIENDWFCPIIACIRDPKCSLEKLKHVCYKVIKIVERKISEHLNDLPLNANTDGTGIPEKRVGRSNTIHIGNSKSEKKDFLLFEALSRMNDLRCAYRDIFNIANRSVDSNSNIDAESKENVQCVSVIAAKDLSNLTFLHEQINKQLVEFLFGSFEDAKKAIDEYLEFLTTAKAELDSLEEELTCKIYKDGGMIFEATRLVSAIKELTGPKNVIYQEGTPPGGHTDKISSTIKPGQAPNNLDIIDQECSSSEQTICKLVSNNQIPEPFANDEKHINDVNSENNGKHDPDNFRGDISNEQLISGSKINTLINDHPITLFHQYMCENCKRWYNFSLSNRLLLIHFISMFVVKFLLRQMNLTHDSLDSLPDHPCFYTELIENNYENIPECCILNAFAKEFKVLHNVSPLELKVRNKKKHLSLTGECNLNYIENSFSSNSSSSHKLTALLLTAQNMTTRAENIIDILRARFCLSSKRRKDNNLHSSRPKEAYVPLAVFPIAIKEQVKKLMDTADKEIIQYLKNNITSNYGNNLEIKSHYIPTTNCNIRLGPFTGVNTAKIKGGNSITPSPSNCAYSSTSEINCNKYSSSQLWFNIIQKVETYCKKCFMLEGRINIGHIDISILEMENQLRQFDNPNVNAQLTIIINDLDLYTARDFILDISKSEDLSMKFDDLDDEIEANSIELKSVDDLWQEILSFVVTDSGDQSVIKDLQDNAPHKYLKSIIEEKQYMYECNKEKKVFECILGAIKIGSENNKYSTYESGQLPPSLSETGFELQETTNAIISTDVSPPIANSIIFKCDTCPLSSIGENHGDDVQAFVDTHVEKTVLENDVVITSEEFAISPRGDNGISDKKITALCEKIQEELDRICSEKKFLFMELESALDNIDMKKTDLFTIIELFEKNLCTLMDYVKDVSIDLTSNISDLGKKHKIGSSQTNFQENDQNSNVNIPLMQPEISSIYLEQLSPSSADIITPLLSYNLDLNKVLIRTRALHASLQRAVNLINCITEYAELYKEKDENVSVELDKLYSKLSLTQSQKEISSNLKFENEELLKAPMKYIDFMTERMQGNFQKIDKVPNLNETDTEFVDIIMSLINDKLNRRIWSEYDNKTEEWNKKITNLMLAVSELSTFFSKLQNFTNEFDSQLQLEAKITPPMFIIPFDLVMVNSENTARYSEEDQIVDINELDKLLHIPLIEKIDEDIISESKLRQSKRRSSLKELQFISSKIICIARLYDDKIFKCIIEIVKDRLEKVSLKFGKLEFVCIEVRTCIEKHLACLKKVNKMKETILFSINNILFNFNDLTEKIKNGGSVLMSADIASNYITEFKNLIVKVTDIFNLAKNIKNEIIKSDLPAKDLNSLLKTSDNIRDCSSFDYLENNRRTVIISTEVYKSINTAIEKVRRDIFTCAHFIMLKFIDNYIHSIHEACSGGLGDAYETAMNELHSDIGVFFNAEAYIPLCRVRKKSLLPKISYIDRQILEIEKKFECLDIVYESWNSLVVSVSNLNEFSRGIFVVQKRYTNATRSFSNLILSFSNLCQLASISSFITNTASLVQKTLKKTLPSKNFIENIQPHEFSPDVNDCKLLEYQRAHLKFLDSSLYYISSLSNEVLTCDNLHITSLVLGSWIIDKLVIFNKKQPDSLLSTVNVAYMSNDLAGCQANAKKITSLLSCIISLINKEKTYVVEFCNDILQKSFKDICADQKCWECCTSHFGKFIVIIRYMGSLIFENLSMLIRLKKCIWNYKRTSESNEGYAFGVYKYIFNIEGISNVENHPKFDVLNSLVKSFVHFSKVLDQVTNELRELLEFMYWAENSLEVCVPAIRALTVDMNSFLSSNLDKKNASFKESDIIKYWGGLTNSWGSQISQIVEEPPSPTFTYQFRSDNYFINDISPIRSNIDYGHCDTLLNAHSQNSCYEFEQDILETLKSVVKRTLYFELNLLNNSYQYVLNTFNPI